jgi:hypothetical protein
MRTLKFQEDESNMAKSDIDHFVRYIGWIFVVTTALTMLGLFIFRVIWIAGVFRWFGTDIEVEDPLGRYFGPIWVSTGDPSVVLYIVVFAIVVPFLLWRRPQVLVVAPWTSAAFKALLLFSLIMIVMQYAVLGLARAMGMDHDRPSGLITETIIYWGDPMVEGSRRLLLVDDPHYVTLLLSFCGLALVSDPGLMRRIWHYLTAWLRNGDRA